MALVVGDVPRKGDRKRRLPNPFERPSFKKVARRDGRHRCNEPEPRLVNYSYVTRDASDQRIWQRPNDFKRLPPMPRVARMLGELQQISQFEKETGRAGKMVLNYLAKMNQELARNRQDNLFGILWLNRELENVPGGLRSWTDNDAENINQFYNNFAAAIREVPSGALLRAVYDAARRNGIQIRERHSSAEAITALHGPNTLQVMPRESLAPIMADDPEGVDEEREQKEEAAREKRLTEQLAELPAPPRDDDDEPDDADEKKFPGDAPDVGFPDLPDPPRDVAEPKPEPADPIEQKRQQQELDAIKREPEDLARLKRDLELIVPSPDKQPPAEPIRRKDVDLGPGEEESSALFNALREAEENAAGPPDNQLSNALVPSAVGSIGPALEDDIVPEALGAPDGDEDFDMTRSAEFGDVVVPVPNRELLSTGGMQNRLVHSRAEFLKDPLLQAERPSQNQPAFTLSGRNASGHRDVFRFHAGRQPDVSFGLRRQRARQRQLRGPELPALEFVPQVPAVQAPELVEQFPDEVQLNRNQRAAEHIAREARQNPENLNRQLDELVRSDNAGNLPAITMATGLVKATRPEEMKVEEDRMRVATQNLYNFWHRRQQLLEAEFEDKYSAPDEDKIRLHKIIVTMLGLRLELDDPAKRGRFEQLKLNAEALDRRINQKAGPRPQDHTLDDSIQQSVEMKAKVDGILGSSRPLDEGEEQQRIKRARASDDLRGSNVNHVAGDGDFLPPITQEDENVELFIVQEEILRAQMDLEDAKTESEKNAAVRKIRTKRRQFEELLDRGAKRARVTPDAVNLQTALLESIRTYNPNRAPQPFIELSDSEKQELREHKDGHHVNHAHQRVAFDSAPVAPFAPNPDDNELDSMLEQHRVIEERLGLPSGRLVDLAHLRGHRRERAKRAITELVNEPNQFKGFQHDLGINIDKVFKKFKISKEDMKQIAKEGYGGLEIVKEAEEIRKYDVLQRKLLAPLFSNPDQAGGLTFTDGTQSSYGTGFQAQMRAYNELVRAMVLGNDGRGSRLFLKTPIAGRAQELLVVRYFKMVQVHYPNIGAGPIFDATTQEFVPDVQTMLLRMRQNNLVLNLLTRQLVPDVEVGDV